MKKTFLLLCLVLNLTAQDVIIKTSKGSIAGVYNPETKVENSLESPLRNLLWEIYDGKHLCPWSRGPA